VVIGDSTGLVDEAATKRRRMARRRGRLKTGKPFRAFAEEWSRQKPKSDILIKYGNWPEPRLPAYTNPFWGIYR